MLLKFGNEAISIIILFFFNIDNAVKISISNDKENIEKNNPDLIDTIKDILN